MYQIEFLPEPLADLGKLDKAVAQRIMNKLRWLAENFESLRLETLSGNLSRLSKLRVGDYRVLYEPDRNRKVLTVHLVGHRREIYD